MNNLNEHLINTASQAIDNEFHRIVIQGEAGEARDLGRVAVKAILCVLNDKGIDLGELCYN